MSSTTCSKPLSRLYSRALPLALAVLFLCASTVLEAAYKPVEGRIMSRWAKEVSPENAHREYPRPQMVRKEWENLNGLWDYATTSKDAETPAGFDGQILVPFAVESALSGVGKTVGKDNILWYRRSFDIPDSWKGKRTLLHFGAVDWHVVVRINGTKVGEHKGGYDPFTLDITDALRTSGTQEITVSVWDPTSDGTQPRGKQVNRPGGIWYTSVTGIWQTVWLEPVNSISLASLKLVPNIDEGSLELRFCYRVSDKTVNQLPSGYGLEVTAMDGKSAAASGRFPCAPGPYHIANLDKLWSPDSPFLYRLKVVLKADGKTVDEIESYFGMRKISLARDADGINRLALNNKPLFQYGPLDQGWWPDGLYTAPTDEALRYDVEILKKLGCNMLRKHVKVEPDRFYYWCDRLGMMVWQDMPNGNNNPGSHEEFELEWSNIISAFKNHPSIVMWVPFNEGWGQYDTERIVELTKTQDPTRLVNNASGWTDKGAGDVHDIHSYPGPAAPPVEEKRAAVLGEFGGLGLPLSGHTWQQERNWGYRSYTSMDDLADAYVNLIHRLRPLIAEGLAAAVYTQTTDVEVEVNGMMTYDREVIKLDPERTAAANRKLYLPPPVVRTVVETSEKKGVQWRYTTSAPPADWYKRDFDDSGWKQGPAGFGTEGTPGTVVRTTWSTPDIWIRRSFELADTAGDTLQLIMHHDEDAQVYINGVLAASPTGYTTSYAVFYLDPKAAKALRKGANTIAIHCKQTTGGQYIDAGLVSVTERDGNN